MVAGRVDPPQRLARRSELRRSPATAGPRCSLAAAEVLGEIRKAKTEAKQSLKAAVTVVVVRGDEARLDAVRPSVADLREAGNVTGEITLELGDPAVLVTLEPA